EDAEGLEYLTEAFIVEEEEELVLDYGSANVKAELVAIEGRLLERSGNARASYSRGLEEAGSVEGGVADELVGRSMEPIGTALRCDIDGRSRGSAILGALVVGYHLELCDGVGRDGDNLVVEPLVAFAIGVIVESIQQKVVEHAALAVDVVGAGADK